MKTEQEIDQEIKSIEDDLLENKQKKEEILSRAKSLLRIVKEKKSKLEEREKELAEKTASIKGKMKELERKMMTEEEIEAEAEEGREGYRHSCDGPHG